MGRGRSIGPSNARAPLNLVLPIVMQQAYYPLRFGAERHLRPRQRHRQMLDLPEHLRCPFLPGNFFGF